MNFNLFCCFYFKGFMPAIILRQHFNDTPNIIHIEKEKLGAHSLFSQLYGMQWKEWRNYDSIHLLINHRSYLDSVSPNITEFNEVNILNYNYTYGEMVREILGKIKRIN